MVAALISLAAGAFAQGATPAPAPSLTRQDVEKAVASGAPLAGMDFSGLPLAGLTFPSSDLANTKWRQTDLRGARFTKCRLQGADFTGALLNGAVLQGCDLTNATLTGALLAGASITSCDLSGAALDKADISGTMVQDVATFPNGAAHLPAVGAAIELRGGARLSPAWLAAASGDAFAFTYNRNDRAAWPGTPLTFNPILLALDTLGYDATYTTTITSAETARKELTAVLRRGLVAILPMRLAGSSLRGDAVEGEVWVAAHQLEKAQSGPDQVAVRTPFGPMRFGMDALLRQWEGPWATLVPAGEGVATAKYPLCAVGTKKAEVSDAAVALAALRHASAIMNDPRSFGGSSGGFDAYQALIQDAGDPNLVIGDLVHWSGTPRRDLAASRGLAAAFLEQAAPKVAEPVRRPLLEAASWYADIATLLIQEWPLPAPEAFEGANPTAAVDAATSRRPDARQLLEEVLARERRAMALLEQAVAEAVKGA
jgi:uncharacterized protein YjbI with pentapeptide repeats